jgi:hypothetical protein
MQWWRCNFSAMGRFNAYAGGIAKEPPKTRANPDGRTLIF